MTFDEFAMYAFAARLAERFFMTAMVLLISIVVMLSFWRTMQKVDFTVTRDKIGAGGTFVLATPVFVLLFLGVFAWVVFSHPIQVDVPVSQVQEDGVALAANTGQSATLSAMVEVQSSILAPDQIIPELNCVLRTAPPEETHYALDQLKLYIMLESWQDDWGDMDDFISWVGGADDVAPDINAITFFHDRGAVC